MAVLAEGKSGSSQFKRQQKSMGLKILSSQKRRGSRGLPIDLSPTYTIPDIFFKLKGCSHALNLKKPVSLFRAKIMWSLF